MYGTAYRDALNRTLALEDEFLYGADAAPPAPATEPEPAKAPKAARARNKPPGE